MRVRFVRGTGEKCVRFVRGTEEKCVRFLWGRGEVCVREVCVSGRTSLPRPELIVREGGGMDWRAPPRYFDRFAISPDLVQRRREIAERLPPRARLTS
jgi:hypothetical protein